MLLEHELNTIGRLDHQQVSIATSLVQHGHECTHSSDQWLSRTYGTEMKDSYGILWHTESKFGPSVLAFWDTKIPHRYSFFHLVIEK